MGPNTSWISETAGYLKQQIIYRDKSALVASSVQPAPNMGLFQHSPVPLLIDLAACAHPYTYYVLSTWAFRGVVSPDFRVNLVQFASMHIHMWFALNAHSICIHPNHIVCEMVQCALKTKLGSNILQMCMPL